MTTQPSDISLGIRNSGRTNATTGNSFREDQRAPNGVVLKTYDRAFAKAGYDQMNAGSLSRVVKTLRLEESYEAGDIPDPCDDEFSEFVWQEILDASREEGNVLSFFMALEISQDLRTEKFLCVSPDWPTAEEFALERLNELDVSDRTHAAE